MNDTSNVTEGFYHYGDKSGRDFSYIVLVKTYMDLLSLMSCNQVTHFGMFKGQLSFKKMR